MKKLIIIVALLAMAFSASAQVFDFSSNSGRVEAGFNIGQVGSTTNYAQIGIGVNVLFSGIYLDFMHAGPQHKYDHTVSNTKWDDNVAMCTNIGYQIPILNWLRVMPLVGYAQTNEGVTDGSSLHISYGDSSRTFYHSYEVTPGSRTHYFNFGGGISIQPCKWFSINGVYTRYGIYGGIGINLAAFIK